MDTPMMNNPKYEDATDEVPEDEVPEAGPETMIKNMRADLFEKTKENIVLITENIVLITENIKLNTDCITQLEFERYYNCDVDASSE